MKSRGFIAMRKKGKEGLGWSEAVRQDKRNMGYSPQTPYCTSL